MNDLRERIAIALAERFEFPVRWHELRYNTQEYNRHTADVVMPIVREAVREAMNLAVTNLEFAKHPSYKGEVLSTDDIVKRICG